MPNVYIESFEEFSQRNGGSPVEHRNRLLFPSGAQCGLDSGNFPRKEPPVNEYERLMLMKEYCLLRVRQAEAEFDTAKSELSLLASNARKYRNLPTPVNAPTILKGLAADVAEKREALTKIESLIAQSGYGQRQREIDEVEQRRKTEIADLHAQLMGIVI